ncbi:hypothetical protein P5673_011932 [Acropora cervicornis]|uniref:Uncharacterized protein n=1 Tax=Acropora cervicornis TaxID=6130 RepID=A0AAD9QP12_ACRCE|nr:hypothetical protein P5673_011932 [Acropora cervicornis]
MVPEMQASLSKKLYFCARAAKANHSPNLQPVSPDANGLFQAFLEVTEDVELNKEELEKKLVGFGCGGASVMVGKKVLELKNSRSSASSLEGCSNMQKLTVSGWNWNG